ncbi:speckle-type POZ protein B [Nasonia vitripennis]|uniref:BTB domain-containing protein n=1 Tax=Nasonia vitripennis TaxID=7425 RepID=A0A7M7QGN1_NASVI|nr:speckle-type POZ protein B [Nasonia vitripennis]
MSLYLFHKNADTVHVNYALSIGSVKEETSYTFKGMIGRGWTRFIKRDEAFKSCQPNGTLIINCEIHAISNVVESSGSNVDQCSTRDETLRSKISDDFLTLLENEKFSDITIKLGYHEIGAHKIILAARSPVLASSIMENSSVSNNGNSSFIEIKNVKLTVFKKLLQYIYTDKLDGVHSNMAKDLLAAAIEYDIKGLKARCEEILCSGQ